jgi:CubicO group peptidase (beta-lactamase class C family)
MRLDAPVRSLATTACLALWVAALSPLAAQSAPDSAVQQWITERVANGYATGIVVGRRDGRRDRIVAAGGTQRDGRPLGGETLFEIGSITKVFTNVVLADMVLKGEVALDDPVQRYLPAGVTMPSRNGKAITLLDLATASSGLPSLGSNMAPKDMRNPYADYSVQQMYDFLSSHTLRRDPGERYEYSNIGMGLLGHVLGLRAGKSWEALLRERVLEPLGMRETFVTVPPTMMGRVAVPHDADFEEASLWDLPTLAGAGALRSTTRDMLKFADAVTHRDRGPLGKAITFSIEPRRPTTSPNMRIALGWHVREGNGRTIVWHNGGTGGFRTFFGFDPVTGAHAMAWSNTASSVDDLGLHLIDSTVPRMRTPRQADVVVAAETLRGYVGAYPLGPGFVIAVSEERGKLYAQATGQPRFRLWAESPTAFYLRVVPAKVRFAADSAGVMTLTLEQGGREQKGRRQ